MKCYACKSRGTPRGMWYGPPPKRTPHVVFVCRNAACLFEYVAFDGEKKNGRPTWMVPIRKVK